jgi:hypothetical protein
MASGILKEGYLNVLLLDSARELVEHYAERTLPEMLAVLSESYSTTYAVIVDYDTEAVNDELDTLSNAVQSICDYRLDTLVVDGNDYYSMDCHDSSCCPKPMPRKSLTRSMPSVRGGQTTDVVSAQPAELIADLVSVVEYGRSSLGVPSAAFNRVSDSIQTRDTLLATAAFDDSDTLWVSIAESAVAETSQALTVKAIAQYIVGNESLALELLDKALEAEGVETNSLRSLVARAIESGFGASNLQSVFKVVSPV